MTTDGVDRRQVLRSLAATAAVAAAGCLSGGDGGDGTPEYAERVPAVEDGVAFSYLRFDITEQTEDDGPQLLPVLLPTSDGEERPVELPDEVLSNREEPLLSFAFATGGWLLLGATFAFGTAGLGSLIERRGTGAVEELFVANRTAMGTGEFDTDEVDQQLRTDTGVADGATYEFVDETDTFRFYERAGGTEDRGPSTVAVSESRVLTGQDRDAIERLVGTVRGERASAADALDGFDWLADTVGEGSLAAGWHGPLDLDDLFGDSENGPTDGAFTQDDDVVFTLSLNPEADEVSVDLAVRSDSLSPDRRDAFERAFNADSHESSVSLENGEFSISGTFDEIPFQPVGTDPTDDLPSGDDLPPEIQEAVPEGAVEISEAPDQEGAYVVEFVEQIDVDEVTVLAVNAGRETTTSTPDSLRSLFVYPNVEDDEIRVIVTVDGVSGIIATKEIP
jgi:hypothetical protein